MTASVTSFALLVQSELRRLKWSQRRLARETGLASSIANRVVKGTVEPDTNTMLVMARALNLRFIDGMWRSSSTQDAEIDELAAQLRELPPEVRAIIAEVYHQPERVRNLRLVYSDA